MVVDLGFRDSWDRVFKALEAQADWVTLARRLGQDIRANADWPVHVRAAWQRAGLLSCLAAETGVTIDRDALGQELAAVFDAALESLHFLRTWAREAEAHGQTVEGAAELQTTIAELEGMRAEALDNWPWTPTKEEWNEGVADFQRGDSLPADEAFAEIARMDRDAWLRRVEEYKRRRGGEDVAR